MKYDIPERIFLVKKFYELKHISSVQRAYRTKYKNQTAPTHSTIKNIISRFEKTGSVKLVTGNQKEPSDKRKEAKIRVENVISEFPSLSIRKTAAAVNISPTLVFTILHDDLHLKPFKLHKWYKLEVHDYEKRV